MATATKIWLTPDNAGVFGTSGLSQASARKVSEVLQHDMENHHVYVNDIEFHNHIVHFMLTIFALGASPETIQDQYEREDRRQRPCMPRDEKVIASFTDKTEFMKHMYQEEHYANYLAFFQREIDAKGISDVLNQYLFAGDELAESLLSRMFAGLVHPIIHLGFGVEFQQPAIIAQALAQASVHADYLGRHFFTPAEKAAGGIGRYSNNTLVQIMDRMRADRKVAASVHYEDSDKFQEGLLKRARDEVIQHCSQWTVSEDQLEDKMAEMINTATQNPKKQIKLDFFYIHAVNLSLLLKAFMDTSYLCTQNKVRLLEMKGRMDLLIWASRNMPQPQIDDVNSHPIHMGWPEVFTKAYTHRTDDGHLAKFVRAVALAEELCQPYEGESEKRSLLVTGDMWLKIGNIAIDAAGKIPSDMWVRGAGFEEAWAKFGDRK
ncbi:hypothetical protein MW887_004515 [Aspergillus wentii]|nr:hypothetical protein MW887_004515 [Aspergillus wentii]